jgi:hypothetical protein
MPHTIAEKLALAAAIAGLAVAGSAGAARADDVYYYGAVVCKGDQALIRFAEASNADAPDFSGTPTSAAAALKGLKPQDPSRCTLADGREIVLKHIGLRDRAGYGECGGDESQIFSLRIGGKKIYGEEIFHNKCGYPYDIASIVIDGRRLTECRTKATSAFDENPKLVCRDASKRLRSPIKESDHPAALTLIRFAPGRQDFCGSLVRKLPPADASTPPWPARASWPSEAIEGSEPDSEGGAPVEEKSIDLDSDGVVDRAVPVELHNGYFDGRFWFIAPPGKSDDEIDAIANRLEQDPDKAGDVRRSGVRVYAGDETVFKEPRYVTLTPFQEGGITYMHGRWASPRLDVPDDIVVKPNAKGGLDEICAWRAVPSL